MTNKERIPKPEKKKCSECGRYPTEKRPKDDCCMCYLGFAVWNDCIDEYEAWLQSAVMSEEEIVKTLISVRYIDGLNSYDFRKLAKSLHKEMLRRAKGE